MFISENLEFANHAIDQEKIDNIGKLINAFSDACDNCSSAMKDSINNNFLIQFDGLFEKTEIGKIDISKWNTTYVESMYKMFESSEVEEIVFGKLNIENVWYMKAMFKDCRNLRKVDISNLDTTNVYRMEYMFNGCTNIEDQEITLNVSSVEYMYEAFTNSSIRKANLVNANKILKKRDKYYFNSNGDTEIVFVD